MGGRLPWGWTEVERPNADYGQRSLGFTPWGSLRLFGFHPSTSPDVEGVALGLHWRTGGGMKMKTLNSK